MTILNKKEAVALITSILDMDDIYLNKINEWEEMLDTMDIFKLPDLIDISEFLEDQFGEDAAADIDWFRLENLQEPSHRDLTMTTLRGEEVFITSVEDFVDFLFLGEDEDFYSDDYDDDDGD